MTSEGIKGILVKGVGGLYGVRPLSVSDSMEETVLCRARGVFRHENITPLPGDFVRILPDGSGTENTGGERGKDVRGVRVDYVIDEILPRKNSLIRPPLANLTHLFVMIPAAKPAPDLLTADKLISIAEHSGIEPVIVINKADLDPVGGEKILTSYRAGGFAAFALSAGSGEGVAELERYIGTLAEQENVIAAFAGASGAGKSTLMGRMFPELKLMTGSLSRKTQRGRHTTRAVELFPVKVGEGSLLLADTPGFSMLDFARFNFYPSADLPETFREFLPFLGKCRYTRCTHTKEEECAVLEAMREGKIASSRHASYCVLYEDFRKKPDWKRNREGLLHE